MYRSYGVGRVVKVRANQVKVEFNPSVYMPTPYRSENKILQFAEMERVETALERAARGYTENQPAATQEVPMSLTTTTIQGTVKPDGTLELDEPLKLPAGRVVVTVQPLPPELTAEEFLAFMEKIRAMRPPDAPWRSLVEQVSVWRCSLTFSCAPRWNVPRGRRCCARAPGWRGAPAGSRGAPAPDAAG